MLLIGAGIYFFMRDRSKVTEADEAEGEDEDIEDSLTDGSILASSPACLSPAKLFGGAQLTRCNIRWSPLWVSPRSSSSVPSPMMVLYAVLYILVVMGFAIRNFTRRDL